MFSNKQNVIDLFLRGAFGNYIQIWDDPWQAEREGEKGLLVIRYRGNNPPGPCFYDAPLEYAKRVFKQAMRQYPKEDLYCHRSDTVDEFLILQGELMLTHEGWHLFGSRVKKKMRIALKEGAFQQTRGVYHLLQACMDAQSFEDVKAIFAFDPDVVIEFSIFGCNYGTIPGRNTMIWEVRKY